MTQSTTLQAAAEEHINDTTAETPVVITDTTDVAPEQELTLEQAQEIACAQLNNAVFFAQFPSIQERMDQYIQECLADNPHYAAALENLVCCLAPHVGLAISHAEVVEDAQGQAMVSQYKCGVAACTVEQPEIEPSVTDDCEAANCAPKPTP